MSSNKNKGGGIAATLALIILAAAIAAFPMFYNFGDPDAEEQFGGSDGAAEEIVAEQNPDYEPWASPLIGELPGEVESGLFAFQAALGAGVLGFAIGNYRGRSRAEERIARESGAAGTAASAGPHLGDDA
ncbi:energy-coupling factor ABC transporter substrate-binding protein [Corynebacterium sp. CCM 9185]|uniref:Cobalt transport protein CbiN n=1 Tax=Corynebacterium marambiense TaxID=2765364 RepID=A0ABS0VWI3_9CORY|nr:energy-coupling factor ABC transporter substrate-binding protein [Corynebacterium marambiense]MBI9001141.1 energy-coupling factor ABC transporter substrate-binding protein [Corynebacterium marambiense]MCK7664382.1 energy-coupling factor ABC transporter substrate-binding protein [Corynebacterium marambiense]MCX7543195.1 energy-coupling factor ABC transporter substrate-binding protein [Corynebacterium marambiense]